MEEMDEETKKSVSSRRTLRRFGHLPTLSALLPKRKAAAVRVWLDGLWLTPSRALTPELSFSPFPSAASLHLCVQWGGPDAPDMPSALNQTLSSKTLQK